MFPSLGQVMVARMALVLWVLECKLVLWLYEQPKTSLLWEHPRMQEFLLQCDVWKTHMHMGSYGASSPKPTFLWAPTPCVKMFSLPLPDREWEPMVTKKVMSDGRTQVTGNASLKGSQTYPKQFGLATVGVWKVAPKRTPTKTTKKRGVSNPPVWTCRDGYDGWTDADLTDVFQFLSLGTMKR